jgi:hypothetical protein
MSLQNLTTKWTPEETRIVESALCRNLEGFINEGHKEDPQPAAEGGTS